MTTASTRIWRAWPRWLALSGFMVCIAAGMFLPVYTDEIGWRFQERAAVDGVDGMFNDLCGPNSLGHPPWFMMPARWYSAIANQTFADPMFVRIEGVLCAIAWAAMLWALVARLEPDRARRTRLHAVAFAMLGLGLLPFLLVMSRPEQPIMLAYTLMMLIALGSPSGQISVTGSWSRAAAWAKCGAIVVLITIAASYHVKGVLYAPVALVCLACCATGRGTLLPRGAAIVAAISVALGAAHYWGDHLKCVAGNPLLAAHYARENVASLLTSSHPASGLIGQFASGLNPFEYVMLALASNWPMSRWLPEGLFPVAALLTVNVVFLILWLAAAALSVRALAQFIRVERIRAFLQPRVPIALAILACIVVWGASQIKRNVYEAAHVLPMLVIFCMLCLTVPRAARVDPVPARWPAWAAVIMVISQAIVLYLVFPPLLAAAGVPGYLDRQPYSVSIAGYGQVRRDIDRAMRMSGIPVTRPLHRLLIDDVTYLALQKDTLPLHRLGVVGAWSDGIDDPVGYLRSRDSDGVVMGCRFLPPDMRAAASRSGQICAISRDGLERLDETGAPD